MVVLLVHHLLIEMVNLVVLVVVVLVEVLELLVQETNQQIQIGHNQ